MPEIFIARQPIYNRTQHVYGYELFYRTSSKNKAEIISDGDIETSQMILDGLTDIGLDNLVGARPAFVNLSRGFLVGKYPLPIPCNRVVIEVHENIVVDDEVIQSIKWLTNQGYTIALDNFVYREEIVPLLEVVSIIKLDIQSLSENRLRDHVGTLKEYPNLKLMASRIEYMEEYEVCRELGFNYFQGFFFCRPKIMKRRRMPTNRMALMQLLAEVQRPDTTVNKMEELISRDVGLSYKLLRYINSAFFGLPQSVDSIHRAIVILGTNVIQKWTTLLMLARVEDKPNELMVTAVVRAKMSELLAQAMGFEAEETCFTVGLLSVLDALLDMPMDSILSMLGLSKEINGALLEHQGVPGKILTMVLHYEFGEWDMLQQDDLDEMVLKDAYLQSIAWATEACGNLLGE